MKKLFTFICVAAMAVVMGNNAQAQIFDLDAATDFYLIWLDESTEQYYEITPRIVKDYRPNGDYGQGVGERFIDIWENTFTFGEVTGKGAMDQIGGYLNFVADGAQGWGGGGFQLVQLDGTILGYNIDFTDITDDYRFHMAVRSSVLKASRISLCGGGMLKDGVMVADAGKTAQFIVGVGDHVYNDPVLLNLTPGFKANEWTSIDIPISQLKDMGWNNRSGSAFRGYYFEFNFGNSANNLAIDATFFYRPSDTGINNPKANNKLQVFVTENIVEVLNATAPVEVYNLSGIKVKMSEKPIFGVEELNKGAYIIKSGSAVAKVIIK
jgi:hypothetical protein